MTLTPSSLLIMIGIFAAVCAWTMLSGFRKMRMARQNPAHPQAPLLAKMGKIQAFAGGAMLLANILFNLPALRALL